MKKIRRVVCGMVAVLGFAAASHAQPPGITREMIASALPVEGAPLAVPGPYKTLSEPAFNSPGHVTFRPADLSAFPAKDTLPVMAWGNGGCAINSTRYGGFLSTIASHGFLVIATAAKEGEKPRQSNADDLRAALNWAEAENKRDGSPLKGKIALDRMAVMGQSCGGFLSVALGVDPRVDTIGVFNSGVQPANPNAPAGPFPTADTLAKLHGPVLLDQRARTGLHDGRLLSQLRGDQPCARVLRRAPRRGAHRDGRSSGRRRVRQRGLELASLAVQGRQDRRDDVRRQGLLALHEQDLGYEVQADELRLVRLAVPQYLCRIDP